jgi:hypothetical protein
MRIAVSADDLKDAEDERTVAHRREIEEQR